MDREEILARIDAAIEQLEPLAKSSRELWQESLQGNDGLAADQIGFSVNRLKVAKWIFGDQKELLPLHMALGSSGFSVPRKGCTLNGPSCGWHRCRTCVPKGWKGRGPFTEMVFGPKRDKPAERGIEVVEVSHDLLPTEKEDRK